MRAVFAPILFGVLVGACFASNAVASTWKRHCNQFEDDLYNAGLDDDQQAQWLASPHIWRGFLWENDAFARGGDRHYTNGMKLSWLHNPCRGKHEWLEHGFLKAHPIDGRKDQRYYTGGVFGMNMYTPSDIRNPARQRFDRPYVGWLYGGWQVQLLERPKQAPGSAVLPEGLTSTTFELQIGIVGPKAAQGPIQEWWHRDWGTSSAMPHWEHQVPDHVGFAAYYQKGKNYWLLADAFSKPRVRGTLFGGGVLGNVATFANIGGVLAFGNPGEGLIAASTIQPSVVGPFAVQLMQPRAPTLMRQPSSNLDEQAIPAQPEAVRKNREWALFVGVDHRLIARSVFIEGKGDAKHDISLVRHVYDVFFGAFVQLGQNHTISFKQLRRSVEFRSSDPAVVKAHDLGQFAYQYSF